MSSSNNKIDSGQGIVGTLASNVLSNVTGIVSTKPMAKYASGARTVLRINGKIAAFAMQVSWNIQTTVTEIRTIDEFTAVELAPKHVVVSGTIGGLHIPGQGASADNIQATISNFLRQQYVTIEVKDSQTDSLLLYAGKAMIVNRAETLQSERLGQVTLNFQAIGWWDEAKDTKIIDPYSNETKPNPTKPGMLGKVTGVVNKIKNFGFV